MNEIFRNKCSYCGKTHEGSTSFSFKFPANYNPISKNISQKLSDDFCVVEDDCFIRVILEIPIISIEESFMWGVWVSQSKENFDYYYEHFDENLFGRETFAWLCNQLPYYEETRGLKCTVFYQDNNSRPKIHIQESNHELFNDFINGITIEKAKMIATIAMHKN